MCHASLPAVGMWLSAAESHLPTLPEAPQHSVAIGSRITPPYPPGGPTAQCVTPQEVECKELSYPSYYRKPFHAYESGNLCWEAALEVSMAAKAVHAPVMDPAGVCVGGRGNRGRKVWTGCLEAAEAVHAPVMDPAGVCVGGGGQQGKEGVDGMLGGRRSGARAGHGPR
eukprot:218477-Chlamydomonas_euryale.AAC.1